MRCAVECAPTPSDRRSRSSSSAGMESLTSTGRAPRSCWRTFGRAGQISRCDGPQPALVPCRLSLVDRTAAERAIAGALRSTINDHGPIGPPVIGSAVKRVLGALQNIERSTDEVPAISRPRHAAGMDVAIPSQEQQAEIFTDEEADEIQEQLDSGVMGPILKKWLRQLVMDRELRVLQECRLLRALEEAGNELRRERGGAL